MLGDWDISACSRIRGRESILGYVQRTLGRLSSEGRCWSFRTNHGRRGFVILHFCYCMRYSYCVSLQ